MVWNYVKVEHGKRAAANAVRIARERRLSGRGKLPGVDPTTSEMNYTVDEVAFVMAMDVYKRENRRPFPTWSEALRVLVALGYTK